MSELTVRDLSVYTKRDKTTIVKKLSFRLSSGESLILLGQSGCGKTMTCRAVMGILDKRRFYAEGSIAFNGTELLNIPEKKRADIYGKKIAFIPQNPMTALDPSVRVGTQMEETLILHTGLGREQRRERMDQALAEAGLESAERVRRSYPYMLSGGMLQRVLIAMALSTEAELIVADEPTTALDVVLRNDIVDSFIRLRDLGAAVLFITHDFAAALRLGGHTIVMRDGAIVEQGETRDLYADPKSDYARALVRASALSKGMKTHADC